MTGFCHYVCDICIEIIGRYNTQFHVCSKRLMALSSKKQQVHRPGRVLDLAQLLNASLACNYPLCFNEEGCHPPTTNK